MVSEETRLIEGWFVPEYDQNAMRLYSDVRFQTCAPNRTIMKSYNHSAGRSIKPHSIFASSRLSGTNGCPQ